MSMNLYWLPVKPKKGNSLSDDLKFVLRKRFEFPVRVEFGEQDLEYLRGLKDAGVKGAEDLISAVEKHGVVQVYEE